MSNLFFARRQAHACLTILLCVVGLAHGGVVRRVATATAMTSVTDRPSAVAWAQHVAAIPPHLGFTSEYELAIDGSRLVYKFVPPQVRQQRCYTGTQLRLFDQTTRATTILDRLPTPAHDECVFYNALSLAGPWVVFQVEDRSTHASPITTLITLNLRTRQRRVLARVHGDAATIVGQDLSGGMLALAQIYFAHAKTATAITLVDIASGRERAIATSPWFSPGDRHAWGMRGISISGGRVVWTRTTHDSADVMLYEGSTGRTLALTHDGISLAPHIYGDTVAWIVSKTLVPEGMVRVRDLHTGQTLTMPDTPGYNIEVGDGLVSWVAYDDPTHAVPLYFVRHHALRYYLPTADEQTQGAYIADIRIFGREVLVPTELYFGDATRTTRLYRLDVY